MELRYVVLLATLAAFGVVVYLGSSVLSLKKRDKKYKTIGLKLLMPLGVVIAMVAIVAVIQSAGPPDFETVTPGPARGTGSVTREVRFPVTDESADQIVELTPLAEQVAVGNAMVGYRVLDREKKELAHGERSVGPAKDRQWETVRFRFEAERSGDHLLVVEMTQEMDLMRVVVKEVR